MSHKIYDINSFITLEFEHKKNEFFIVNRRTRICEVPDACGFMTLLPIKLTPGLDNNNFSWNVIISYLLSVFRTILGHEQTNKRKSNFKTKLILVWIYSFLTSINFPHVIDMLAVVTHLVQRLPVYHDPTAIICKGKITILRSYYYYYFWLVSCDLWRAGCKHNHFKR